MVLHALLEVRSGVIAWLILRDESAQAGLGGESDVCNQADTTTPL